MEKIKIEIENNEVILVDKGITFKEVVDNYFNDEDIVLCDLNGSFYELSLEIPFGGRLKTINSNSDMVWKVYSRTLQFIFIKVIKDMFPEA